MPYSDHREGIEFSSGKKIFLLVSVLFVALLMISAQVVLKNKQSLLIYLLSEAISPFQKGVQGTINFVQERLERFFHLSDIERRYRQLQERYRRLLKDYYLLKKDFWPQKLRSEISVDDYLLATVIYIDQNFPFETVQINRGKRDGVNPNMVVLNQDMEVVGRVVEPVSNSAARVLLITSSRSAIGAFIEDEKIEGLLQGNGTGTCLFKYIIEDRKVIPGSRLVTSGSDQIFHPYFPVGRINTVEKGSYLTLKITVEPFFIKKSIKYLFLLKGQIDEKKTS